MKRKHMISKINVNKIINPQADIYRKLREDPPAWWKRLKDDGDIYIEIRKKDIIDAYFLGARIAEIKYDGDRLTARCHAKYLGSGVRGYVECQALIETRLDEMKRNSVREYSGEDTDENISEKRIQGVLRKNPKYLDSEFAFRYQDGERETIRIDMVGIENDTLVFEELKRISDGRLLRKDVSHNPEVTEQMEKYRQFISENAGALVEYYESVWNIKRDLGLPVPERGGGKLRIDLTPLLTVVNTYRKKVSKAGQKRRDARIRDIRNVLQRNNIKFEIKEL